MFQNLIVSRDKKAIQYGESVYSYNQLLQHSQLYANYMKSICNDKIDRVMFFSKNTPEYIFALYGAFRVGAITIPVDVMSTVRELAYMIDDSRPEVIYTTSDKREHVMEAAQGIEGYTPIIFTCEEVDTKGVEAIEPTSIAPRGVDDVMTLIYTSGTTGSPKGVMLTFGNLWYNVDAVSNQVPIFNEETRTLMLLPIHHIFAYAGALVAPIYSGGEIHIVEALTPESILGTLVSGRCTVMLGVPRLYETFAKGIMSKINENPVAKVLYHLCAAIGSDSLTKKIFKSVHDKFGGHMKYFVSGGAALPIETATLFKNLGLYVLEGYGMSECAPMIAFTRPGERAIGYCGRMLPNCEHKIVELDELCVRGKNVMKGYYNRPEETAQIIRDGWLHTGDTASYDPVKGLRITGRIKEIIVTPNGKNINPAEIENLITQSSTYIKEMAVVLHNDLLHAIVYPNMEAINLDTQRTTDELVRSEIEAYNREAIGYKRIMRYNIISQELPKTRLGKTQRFKLTPLVADNTQQEQQREDISGRSERYHAIKKIVDELSGKYANPDSHFEIDLALDSLGRVSLLAFIEEHYGLTISESELSQMPTLNLIVAHVESNGSENSASDEELNSLDWSEILSQSDEALKSMQLPHSGFIHLCMDSLFALILSLFYRFTSRGKENIPTDEPVIFVANHRSSIDGVVVSSKLSWSVVRNTFFFAKDKHFQGGFKQFMARHNNIILMNVNTNVKESMQQMYHLLKQGKNIIIFPEGTRSKDGTMKSFKETFAILSKSLGVKVIPVAITGSESSTYRFIKAPKIGNKLTIDFLPAMLPDQGESTQDFTHRVKSAIESELA